MKTPPLERVTGIIQARIGSTRLPGKMLLPLHDRPIIEWVVRRVARSTRLDALVVALPDTEANDPLAACVSSLGVSIFRGPEDDVLRRFHLAAQDVGASHIVRVCADNPLISWEEIDHLIDFFRREPCDYAYNHIPRNNRYPDGLGAEMVPFSILERIERLAVQPNHREHCLLYILDHPDHFSIRTFDPPNEEVACPDLRLDVDTREDLDRLSARTCDLYASSEDVVRMYRSA